MYRYLQARSKVMRVRLDAELLKIQHETLVTFEIVSKRQNHVPKVQNPSSPSPLRRRLKFFFFFFSSFFGVV